jgi:hypothetical protein
MEATRVLWVPRGRARGSGSGWVGWSTEGGLRRKVGRAESREAPQRAKTKSAATALGRWMQRADPERRS